MFDALLIAFELTFGSIVTIEVGRAIIGLFT